MKAVFYLSAIFLLSSCETVPITGVPTGGSRADGTVILSYEHGVFQNVELQANETTRIAANRCQAWGYNNASSFGGGIRTCTSQGNDGTCYRFRVDITYQCTN